jgi:hypothetical protein
LPSVTVARSSFAHDAASEVDESEDEHPVSVSATAITRAEKIPKRFFTITPQSGWIQANAIKAINRCLHASYMQKAALIKAA